MTENHEITADLRVGGMHCATCALSVEGSVGKLEGVRSAEVNLASEKVRLVYDPGTVTLRAIEESIQRAGFTPLTDRITVRIGGMHCAMCVQAIDKAISALPGVISVSVNLGTEQAYIVYYAGITPIDTIKKAITDAGFRFAGIAGEEGERLEEEEAERDLSDKKIRIVLGFGVSAFLMALMFLHPHLPIPMPLLMFLIATPFFAYLAYPIFKAAVRSLGNGILDMDVMYALGIGTAYGSSVLGTFGLFLSPDFNFYETAIMLTAFLTLGRYLEARAKGRTNEAIRSLVKLQPKQARIIRDGQEVEVPIDDIAISDLVIVRPGEAVPVDGTVVEGESYLDESLVTGEPIPVYKGVNGSVIGGTISTNGAITISATRIGKDTVLARIIRMVEEAQGSKPPVQRIADRVVSYFIPAVLTIAAAAFLFWYLIAGSPLLFAVTALISVVVVACPCALGLATPTAITVGVGRGAELGILIRNGEVLERSGAITIVAIDKTGTLTKGTPAVTDTVPYDRSVEELLSLAASVEVKSLHPLAEAIVHQAEEVGAPIHDVIGFETFGGLGVVGFVNGISVIVGTRSFLESRSVMIPKNALGAMVRLETEGKTVPLIAADGRYAGCIAIADPLKSTSAEAVKLFEEMGLSVVMITGDNERTASVIGEEVGIRRVLAGVLPEDKAGEVKRLQQQGEVVAFIGDGINDAPALAQADVGIAISGGTDVAVESGGIVLMHDDLIDAAAAIQLARKVMGRIRQNLFWAFFYNILLIPIAAGLLTPLVGITFRPEYAGLAMALSSVTIVSLSLLLKGYNPPAKRPRTIPADAVSSGISSGL
ncbi:heavy metal translocating P-type ATPase [Methanocalculus sp.]|uniref:heavy metal translocating P-type ATPase n=1 Tax=Methanocalculus sp. TaxID=2004547 RepID=UPI0027278B80|nr:heavy metal translocating P-type ATPase [Methanocalculus sp.]MDO8841498.1 heavy metal translocating P-type ATPase [Methanocalculus sp.]